MNHIAMNLVLSTCGESTRPLLPPKPGPQGYFACNLPFYISLDLFIFNMATPNSTRDVGEEFLSSFSKEIFRLTSFMHLNLQDLLAILMQYYIKMYISALNHQQQHQTCLAGMVLDSIFLLRVGYIFTFSFQSKTYNSSTPLLLSSRVLYFFPGLYNVLGSSIINVKYWPLFYSTK